MTALTTVLFIGLACYAINREKYFYIFVFVHFILRLFGHTYGINFVHINLGFLQLYSQDIFVFCLLIKDINKITLIPKRFTSVTGYMYLLTALLSMAIGLTANGLNSDMMSDIRTIVYFALVFIYFSRNGVNLNYIRKYGNITLTLIGVFCIVCWITSTVGLRLTPTEGMRVIGSDYASIVSVYTIILLYLDLYLSDKHQVSKRTFLFLSVVVLLQHNSVWMCTLAGCLILLVTFFWRKGQYSARFILQGFLVAAIICAVLYSLRNTPLIAQLESTFDKFQQVSETLDSNYGSFSTRMDVWLNSLKTLSGVEWLIGKPMGSGYYVSWKLGIWQTIPHSAYVENIMRVGLSGCSLLLINLIYLSFKSIKQKKILYVAILGTITVYWINYGYSLEHAIIIGAISFFVSNSGILNEENGREISL